MNADKVITPDSSLFRNNMADFAFFVDDARDELLKKLAHLIDYTPLILAVVGPQGVGKTALLKHRFIYNKKSSWRTCVIDADYCKSPEQLYEKINKDLQLTASPANSHQQLENIAEQLDTLAQNNINALLIIDNAENINKALLPVITGLCIPQPDFPPLLRLVLFGQRMPKNLMDAATKESRADSEAVNLLALEPFNLEGTRQYIFHCLEHMGIDRSAAFDNNLVQEIHEKSGGLIPAINSLASKVLPVPGGRKKTAPADNNPLKLVAIALIVSIALALFLFDEPDTEKENIKLAAEGQRVTQAIELPDQNAQQNEPVFPELRRDAFLAPPPQPEPEVAVEQTANTETNIAETENMVADDAVEMVVMDDETSTPSEPEQSTAATETETAVSAAAETNNPDAEIDTQQVAEPGLSAERIRSLPSGHYTIQLIASGNEKAVKSYIERHQLGLNATHVHTKRDNKDWYAVIYGTYADRNEANNAVGTLPNSIQNTKPWIRTLGGLQKTMVP